MVSSPTVWPQKSENKSTNIDVKFQLFQTVLIRKNPFKECLPKTSKRWKTLQIIKEGQREQCLAGEIMLLYLSNLLLQRF